MRNHRFFLCWVSSSPDQKVTSVVNRDVMNFKVRETTPTKAIFRVHIHEEVHMCRALRKI